MISSAERFILIDMFLFNDFQGAVPERHRALSAELTRHLIAQKQKHPQMQVLLITDPFNRLYGGLEPGHFIELEAAGISVTYTRLTALRDSNLIYSPIWRTFIGYWGNDIGSMLPNPVGQGRVSVRIYLSLLNFKANHRKVVIVDQGDDYIGLVTSANPHDGSSAHSNVALRFSGPAVADLLETEIAVLKMSGGPEPEVVLAPPRDLNGDLDKDSTLEIITERGIKYALLESINATEAGDRLDIAVFYLSDRQIVQALKDAYRRGVHMRVLLDPSKDAFGRSKNGIPNRQTAHELQSMGVPVRWCDTHGEQCHSKLLLAQFARGEAHLILGSANFTRRNLDDLNLETSVRYIASSRSDVIQNVDAWFEMRWSNLNGRQFSVDYETYADESWWRRIAYRLMEATGASTF
ncbi:MAG: phospholipase D-like domain-containing protein [Gammaproteobacteria bacterium]